MTNPAFRQNGEGRGDTLFDQQAFARAVRVRIAELGVSGRDAADMAKVSRSTMSRITRRWSPDVETYLRINKWLIDTRPSPKETGDG